MLSRVHREPSRASLANSSTRAASRRRAIVWGLALRTLYSQPVAGLGEISHSPARVGGQSTAMRSGKETVHHHVAAGRLDHMSPLATDGWPSSTLHWSFFVVATSAGRCRSGLVSAM